MSETQQDKPCQLGYSDTFSSALFKYDRVESVTKTYLRYGSIVPNVAFVWENVSHISELAFLHVLLYWVQEVFCSDLKRNYFTFPLYLMVLYRAERACFKGQ